MKQRTCFDGDDKQLRSHPCLAALMQRLNRIAMTFRERPWLGELTRLD